MCKGSKNFAIGNKRKKISVRGRRDKVDKEVVRLARGNKSLPVSEAIAIFAGMERIEREKAVVGRMIAMYCRAHHGGGEMCAECRELLEYARKRLSLCPKGNAKTSCRKCLIHCYAPDKREQIRSVMRYAGPRMLFVHPVAAIRHIISELK